MITIEQARQAMTAGTKVSATVYGKTVEGTISAEWVWAPTGYKQMGLVLPVNAPEGEWDSFFTVEFMINDKLQSADNFILEELELVEDPAAEVLEEPAETETTATLTSYQLSTNHTHVWPQEKINERLAWIFQHCRYGFWTSHDAKGDVVAMYVAILGPGDRVEIVYVLEH